MHAPLQFRERRLTPSCGEAAARLWRLPRCWFSASLDLESDLDRGPRFNASRDLDIERDLGV